MAQFVTSSWRLIYLTLTYTHTLSLFLNLGVTYENLAYALVWRDTYVTISYFSLSLSLIILLLYSPTLILLTWFNYYFFLSLSSLSKPLLSSYLKSPAKLWPRWERFLPDSVSFAFTMSLTSLFKLLCVSLCTKWASESCEKKKKPLSTSSNLSIDSRGHYAHARPRHWSKWDF